MSAEKRKQAHTFLTEDERQIMKDKAAAKGFVSDSAYIRHLILTDEVVLAGEVRSIPERMEGRVDLMPQDLDAAQSA